MSGGHCRFSLNAVSFVCAGLRGVGAVQVRRCAGRAGAGAGGHSVSDDMERSMERRHPIPYSSKLFAHEYGGGMIEFACESFSIE